MNVSGNGQNINRLQDYKNLSRIVEDKNGKDATAETKDEAVNFLNRIKGMDGGNNKDSMTIIKNLIDFKVAQQGMFGGDTFKQQQCLNNIYTALQKVTHEDATVKQFKDICQLVKNRNKFFRVPLPQHFRDFLLGLDGDMLSKIVDKDNYAFLLKCDNKLLSKGGYLFKTENAYLHNMEELNQEHFNGLHSGFRWYPDDMLNNRDDVSNIKGRVNFKAANGCSQWMLLRLVNLVQNFCNSGNKPKIIKGFMHNDWSSHALSNNAHSAQDLHTLEDNQITIYFNEGVDVKEIEAKLKDLERFLSNAVAVDRDNPSDLIFGHDTKISGAKFVSYRNEFISQDGKLNIDIYDKPLFIVGKDAQNLLTAYPALEKKGITGQTMIETYEFVRASSRNGKLTSGRASDTVLIKDVKKIAYHMVKCYDTLPDQEKTKFLNILNGRQDNATL